MITIEIPETKRRIYMPEHLGECDSRQYAEACMLLWRYEQGEMSYHDFRVDMVYKLLNLKRSSGKFVEAQQEDMYSNIYMLSTYVDSFFEKDEQERFVIKQEYTKNHSPSINDDFRNWIGPADNFDNISFGQYVDALNLYGLLEKEKSKDLMYMLMATFYFPPKEKYASSQVQEKAKHFKKVYFGRVYGFFLLFASFQKYLFSAKVYYQGNELDLSILFESEDTSEDIKSNIPGIGMLSIAHQLAESGVYGPIKEVRETNFWEVMLRLYDIRKRDLDHEARRKKEESKLKSKSR